jgi:hypothetical protein
MMSRRLVIAGASQLVGNLVGDAGCHARTALCALRQLGAVPKGTSTDFEMIVRLKVD